VKLLWGVGLTRGEGPAERYPTMTACQPEFRHILPARDLTVAALQLQQQQSTASCSMQAAPAAAVAPTTAGSCADIAGCCCPCCSVGRGAAGAVERSAQQSAPVCQQMQHHPAWPCPLTAAAAMRYYAGGLMDGWMRADLDIVLWMVSLGSCCWVCWDIHPCARWQLHDLALL